MSSAGAGAEEPLDRLGDEDRRRRPAVARLEDDGRDTADRLADEVVVAGVPCAPAQVPKGALGQTREVHRPLLELDRRDPGEREPEIDPEADRDARRDDGVGGWLDLVAERPRPLEDRQDVLGDVRPGQSVVVDPAEQQPEARIAGQPARTSSPRGCPALTGGPLDTMFRHAGDDDGQPCTATYRRLTRRLPPAGCGRPRRAGPVSQGRPVLRRRRR